MHRHASLNRIFRLVWSHVHQAWVAVAETSRGNGKRASRKLLLAAAALAAAQLAQAGPLGGQVTNGSGSITQSGSTTTINQSSQNLMLQWGSFNTSASETVNFVQPSKSAIAVNRILDNNATQFFGKLNANGQVWLVNPNGVLFGAGAQVNVGGLVASTLDVDDQSVGNAARRFTGAGTGSIVNQGTITAADGGYVAFIGNRVVNQGSIAAPGGTVALGAGSDVTLSFAGDSLLNMQVNQSTLDNLAENGGLISASGGAVILSAGAKDAVLASVVNNTGLIEARSVREVGGAIVLDGGQNSTVTNSGTLDAAGRTAGALGGTVKVLGQEVNLAATSKIDVSGDLGGGTAYVGGNFLGAGPERNALNTTVAAGAAVLADAVSSGNGGNVAIWSDGATRFDGSISATGGAASGNGGNVETSGQHLTIGATASVDTRAPRGAAGDWLLDPQDLTIGGYFDGESDITGRQITTALETTNVTIKTGPSVTCAGPVTCAPGTAGSGDIVIVDGAFIGGTFSDDGDLHWGGNTTLTLSAYRNIDMRQFAVIDASGGPSGSLVMRADNTGTGVGTVLIHPDAAIFGSSGGTVQIYYNPTSYSTPTNYAGMMSTDGQYYVFNNANLSTYMLVNVLATVANKTYDGTMSASLSATPTTRMALLPGVSIDTSGAYATFLDKNAGVNKATLVGGLALGGVNASQYALNGLGSSTATIAKANLAVSGVTANGKTYNGTTAATLSGSASVTALGSDAVSVAGSGVGTFADKNAGAGKAVTVSGFTLAGTDAGNYTLIQPLGLTATINRASLAVSGVSALGKTYDGTTAATLGGTATVSAFGSDAVSVAGSGTGVFADKNAAANKAVTVTGYTLAGADANNYNLLQPSGLVATISKANLTVSGIGAFDKTYDGTTAATLFGSASVAGLGADNVTVGGSGTGTFANKNAGAGKTVTVAGYTLGGTDAGNYNLVQPSGLTASIAKANLALTGLTANNKTYDGTTAGTLAGTASVSAFGADVVSVTGSGTATFVDKNAGAGKAVSVSGYALAGSDAGNYNLVQPTGLNADIARANLAVSGIVAANKTYDTTTSAILAGTAGVAAFGSDAVSVTGSGTGLFASKNAGANQAVTVTGYTLGGADAGNYNIVQPTGLVATIGKAGLAIGGLSASNKVYDATTAATLAGTATVAALDGDVVTVSGTGNGVFADKNAGNAKAVTVSGYTLSGADAGNYTLTQPSGLVANIGKASLALSGVTANSKTYDSTTAATLAGTASVSTIGSDVVTVTGSGSGTFADKNAGLGKAVTVSGYALAGADAGNYNLVLPSGLTADIARANLAVTGVTASNKTYDTTTAATLGGTAAVAAFGSDAVAVGGVGAGTFADKNAGIGKAVTVSGFALTGADAANYNIVQPTGLVADIGKASLVVGGVAASDKVYDATTAATLAGTATIAALGADVVTVNGTGVAAFADKNAGAGKAVLVSGYTLSGADAGNYTLAQPSGLVANIGKASLALSGVTANSKTYDSTTAATLAGTASVAAIGSDVVSVTGSGTGTFADKNAGLGKAVTVSGYALAGADAGNYNLVLPSGLTADIARANLAVTGVTASNKTYDTTTAAILGGSAAVAALGSDAVAVGGVGAGTFANKNAGIGKAVTVSGFALTGADAANYNIVQPTGLVADIGKASLAVGGVAASDKVYDATTAATLAGTATIAALGADVVAVNGTGVAAFADKNAGAGKAVLVSGYTLTGADAGNYTLAQPSGLVANIGKASLALSGVTANSKTYDSTTAATLAGTASVAAIGSDVVSVTGSGSGTFADKNVGLGKAVTVSGYALAGADAGNYNLVLPAGLTADIARANLAVTGVTASNKTYDTTTAATLGGSAAVAAFGSDAVAVGGAGTGTFANKNAGIGKAVTVNGFTLTGADAANYNIVQPTGLVADIGKASLVVGGVAASDKVYDATTAATLAGTATIAALGADVVTVNGTGVAAFADKNAGAGKTVMVSGYTLSGADAGNYTLAQPSGLVANIGKASLALTGVTANSKTYDSTTAATLTGTASASAIGSDVVSVTGNGTGTFVDKNAGLGKVVSVSGYALVGTDAGNYNLVLPAGLTADIARANLAVTGVTAGDKTYDATNTASLVGTATVAALGSDVVAVGGAGTGVFADKNAGASKAVTVTGFTLTGQDAANYTVLQPAGLSATISRANLNISGLAASDKVYDGTVAASLAGTATVAALGADAVGVAGSGTAVFADKNAGAGKTVVVSGYTLTGADADNYTLAQPAGLTASIAKAGLVLSGVTANGKVYDGTTAATLTGSAAVAAIDGDVVSVTGNGTGTFADKNAGANKLVTASGYALTGADAGNYTLLQPENLRASIAKADLAVRGVTASNKVYDGTTAATLGTGATVSAFGADVVSLTGGTGVFADKNAGAGKAVVVSGFTLGGLDAGNYNVVQPTGVFADIGKAQLAVTGVTAADKVYDGTNTGALAGTATIAPFGTDAVALSGTGVATFADKNAGAGKPVAVSGYTLAGADAGNYNITLPAALRATITQARLVVTGITASDKTFDGTTTALISTAGVNLAGKVGADSLTVTSTGAFADAAAGTNKTVNLSNTYGGADAANYAIVDQATTQASIAALPQAPVTPVTVEVRQAVAQVQSTVLAPQASTQPQSLTLASTVREIGTNANTGSSNAETPPADDNTPAKAASGLINTRFGAGPNAPTLQIQDGGVQLPALANNNTAQ